MCLSFELRRGGENRRIRPGIDQTEMGGPDGTTSSGNYRMIIGWCSTAALILINFAAYAVLYFRGSLNPLRAYNPTILAALTLYTYPNLVWVQLRETGLVSFTCYQQMWLCNITVLIYSIPIIVFSYRLVLVSDYEKSKITFAIKRLKPTTSFSAVAAAAGGGGGPLTPVSATALNTSAGGETPIIPIAPASVAALTPPPPPQSAADHSSIARTNTTQLIKAHTAKRMIVMCVVFLIPPAVYLTWFDVFGRRWLVSDEYDWDALYCKYGVRDWFIPYFMTTAYCTFFGVFISYQIWSHRVEDGFGIRHALHVLVIYTNVVVWSWIVLNHYLPNINIEYIESSMTLDIVEVTIITQLIFIRTSDLRLSGLRRPRPPLLCSSDLLSDD